MLKRLLIAVAISFCWASAVHAVQSCTIEVKDSNGTVTDSVTYSRGDDIGGKHITKMKDCDVCRSGGRNEGPGYCAQEGGDEYTIRCVKNSGKDKEWDAPC